MDKSLIPQYLANVLAIARADNVISDSELAAVEEVCSEVGGKKTDLKKAGRLVEADDFAPQPIGRFSDKVRNAEDMIYVALTDGGLGQDEIGNIIPFLEQVGLHQEVVDAMIKEGQTRVNAKKTTTTCPSCGAMAVGGAKFCPECGTQIAVTASSEQSVRVEFDYPSEGISIEFAESSSANFDAALAAAKTAPDFQMCEKSGKQWHLATWPQDQIIGALSLVDALKGLRNRKAYVDGESVQWDELFGFNWCFQKRQQAYRPTEYCFGAEDNELNVWGCKEARMPWSSWADWLSYGKFKEQDVFVFDKDRIRHELETNLHTVRFCPCLRSELVLTVLQLLPDQVRVSERTGWSYNEGKRGPNSIKVIQEEEEFGEIYKDEIWVSGVSPVGCNVATEILERALKQCGIQDVNQKALTPGQPPNP